MTKTKVLVTGGAGFIGANLCSALLATGRHEVTVLDDLSTGHRSNLDGLDVRFIEGSIVDPDAVAEATPEGGVVVHLAALGSVPRSVADPVTSHEVNATGTLRVLEGARAAGVAQLLLASSSSVYGDNDAPAKHENLPVAPKSPYGGSKLAAEGYALAYQRTYELPILAFRFFNVFGPLQTAGHAYAAVIPSFIDRAMRGEPESRLHLCRHRVRHDRGRHRAGCLVRRSGEPGLRYPDPAARCDRTTGERVRAVTRAGAYRSASR